MKEHSIPSRTCLVLGQSARGEFAPLMNWLKQASAAGELEYRATTDADEALRWLRNSDWTAELAIVLQEYPGEYTAATATALLSAAPLCRWICCGGTWCDSELRHGSSWPPAVHVPAGMAVQRVAREMQVLSGAIPPVPLTAGRDEIFAADSQALFAGPADETDSPMVHGAAGYSADRRGRGNVVLVSSPDCAFREYAADVLRGADFQIRHGHPAITPDTSCDECLRVIDLDPRGVQQPARWPFDRVPALGLMALPTADDYREAAEHPGRCLLPKLATPAALRRAALELVDRYLAPC